MTRMTITPPHDSKKAEAASLPGKSGSKIDWYRASPDEIKAEIARTRAHMDEHLAQLGRKIRPKANLKRMQIPFAALFVMVSGLVAFRLIRRRSKLKTWSGRVQAGVRKAGANPNVKRVKLRSAGFLDQIRAVRLAINVARKGKPAIFIVEPRKG
ncbi:MAG: hypothetical protein JWO30_2364 [Fibrobacteres bacterium]|nr:hypothetical protein [Fibrobacterota bacterium]